MLKYPPVGDGLLVEPRRAAGAAGLARRRRPLRGSPDRAVEAAAGGEHVRVRGRARDVGDAEPHHGGAGAQAVQPVPAAAAVDGEGPALPGLLEGHRARLSMWLSSFFIFTFLSRFLFYCLCWALRCSRFLLVYRSACRRKVLGVCE